MKSSIKDNDKVSIYERIYMIWFYKIFICDHRECWGQLSGREPSWPRALSATLLNLIDRSHT